MSGWPAVVREGGLRRAAGQDRVRGSRRSVNEELGSTKESGDVEAAICRGQREHVEDALHRVVGRRRRLVDGGSVLALDRILAKEEVGERSADVYGYLHAATARCDSRAPLVASRQAEALAYEVPAHLVRYGAEHLKPSVAQVALHRRVGVHAVTGEDAHATVGRSHRELAGGHVGHRGLHRALAAVRLEPGGLLHEQAGLLELGCRVGERMLQRLERTDWPAEGLPLARVLKRLVERRLSDADPDRGRRDPLVVE